MKSIISCTMSCLFLLFIYSCGKEDDLNFLFSQQLTESQIESLINSSLTIQELREYTGIDTVKIGNPISHENELVSVYAETSLHSATFPNELMVLYQNDTISMVIYYLRVEFTANKAAITDRLKLVLGDQEMIDFSVIVRGTVQVEELPVNGGIIKRLYLNSNDIGIIKK
jgi:hypothetical protein